MNLYSFSSTKEPKSHSPLGAVVLPALSWCKSSVAEAFVGDRKCSCALLIFAWTQISKDLYLASLRISSCQSSLACTVAAILNLCGL